MSSPVPIGSLLAGKYRVEAILGEGAMGVVVAATHEELDKRVALKFMKLAALAGGDGIERFLREARAAGQLRSEHVAHVFDVGRLANDAPYIVMELLEGEDLGALLERTGPLPSGILCRYITEVCEAMTEAHAKGIVHRDLKPQNLFRARRSTGDVIKVLDFGVSKVKTSSGLHATQTASVIGTPVYMAPEQMASSKHVDGRADIWSLGVIMYQLLLGRLPFDGDDFLQIAVGIATTTPVPPREILPGIDHGLEAIILKCLEKRPDRRFATAADLAAALAPFVDRSQIATDVAARPVGEVAPTLLPRNPAPAAAPRTSVRPSTLGTAASQFGTADDPAPSRRRQWLFAGLALATVATLVGAVVISARPRDDTREPAILPTRPPTTPSEPPQAAVSTPSVPDASVLGFDAGMSPDAQSRPAITRPQRRPDANVKRSDEDEFRR